MPAISVRTVEMTPSMVPAPELLPRPDEPVQVVVYGPGKPRIIEGSADRHPDGSIDLRLPIDGPLPEGTTVQVILYPPGDPQVTEGVVGPPAGDGSFEIVPVA